MPEDALEADFYTLLAGEICACLLGAAVTQQSWKGCPPVLSAAFCTAAETLHLLSWVALRASWHVSMQGMLLETGAHASDSTQGCFVLIAASLLLQRYPGLVQVRLPMSSSTGAAKGFAFVVGCAL